MEHRVVVRAVDLVVRRAVIARHVRDRTLAPETVARIALRKGGLDAARADGGGGDPCGVGAASH